MSLVQEAKEEILSIVAQALHKFEKIDVATWNHKSAPSQWSKKELLGHLADSASNNLRRLIVAQYEQGVKIVYDQDKWVEYQHYQELEVEQVISLWTALNQQIAHVISHIPQRKLDYTVDTGMGKSEVHSLVYFIEDYIVHLNYHLVQIYSDAN